MNTKEDVKDFCSQLLDAKPNEIQLSGNTFGVEALAAISKCLGDELRVAGELLIPSNSSIGITLKTLDLTILVRLPSVPICLLED